MHDRNVGPLRAGVLAECIDRLDGRLSGVRFIGISLQDYSSRIDTHITSLVHRSGSLDVGWHFLASSDVDDIVLGSNRQFSPFKGA